MAVILQKQFSWEIVEASSDMDRLKLVLSALPDENLMRRLEDLRRGRRDDYPIRAMWNSVIAGVVFGHESVQSLRRELKRNAELRHLCGFPVLGGGEAVPDACVYSRFLKKLFDEQELIDAMFDELVEQLRILLPGFGVHLAGDSKALKSYAKGRKDPKDSSDPDADWGKKVKRGQRKDGTWWEKVDKWFGYKLHLIVDTEYELPVAWEVTKASVADGPELLPMMEQTEEKHSQLVQTAKYMCLDKGYDSEQNNRELWDRYGIKPIIPAREMWKEDKDLPRQLFPERVDVIFYGQQGQVLCRCLDGEQEAKNYMRMAYDGFEENRGCLKYRCPAVKYGITCTQREMCNGGKHTDYGRIVRIPLELDRRMFVPLPRHCPSHEKEYNRRSAVERVNSRIAGSFGFERHFIRGKAKMDFRCGLALAVMLAMAVGRIRADQPQAIRSLVRPVPDPKAKAGALGQLAAD